MISRLIISAVLLLLPGMRMVHLTGASGQAVVVELFTSEGCSSCPPAERVQQELQKEYDAKQQPVVFLSMHVDYWNHLGWKDPYSQKAFSERQYDYSHAMGLSGAYTPQSVVNGRFETVGSEKEKLKGLIDAELNSASASSLRCHLSPSADTSAMELSYTALSQKNAILTVVIYEKAVTNEIRRGENRGLSIQHSNVVEYLEKYTLKGASGELLLKPGFHPAKGKYRLLAYLQEPASMNILAVSSPIDL